MNMALTQGTGGPAIIYVKAPKHEMDACTRAIQILIASFAGNDDERTLIMYDLAITNSQWSTVDGDLAFNYVPRGYTRMKWIGIVPLTNNRYTSILSRKFLGKHGSGLHALVNIVGRKHIGVFVLTKATRKPYIAVCGWATIHVRRAIELVRDRLVWAEGELRRQRRP
jgi:hypothetical protein